MGENQLIGFKNLIKNDTVFIIGGGTSATSYVNPDDLKNEKVIALNSSFTKYPHAQAIFWIDSSWSAKYDHKLANHQSKYRFNSRPGQHDTSFLGPGRSYILERESDTGFSNKLGFVSGNNSGTQCLNFCITCKPTTIVLIGFDLCSNRGKTHCHDEYEQPTPETVFSDNFLPNFKSLYDSIKHLENMPTIINASPISKLPFFEKDDYRKYIKNGS